MPTDEFIPGDAVENTTRVISAFVSNNAVSADGLPALITAVHETFEKLKNGATVEPKKELVPAVPVKKSVTNDYIICLEDGKKFRSLKRHLRTHYDMSPEEYRAKWELPGDYPMVSANYANARSELAKKMGLGRRGAPVAYPAAAE